MQVDTLAGGARRFAADGSTILLQRVKPGVLWMRAQGYDRGQFGDLIVRELSTEIERFTLPVALFVDARAVPLVHSSAQRVWIRWFEAQRDLLKALHVLAQTSGLRLAVSIAQHYARIPLVTHAEVESFERDIQAAALGCKGAPEAWGEPATIHQRDTQCGSVVTDQRLRAEFHSPRPGVLRLTLSGTDDGTLANTIFDKLRAYTHSKRPLELFIDLRGVDLPASAVRDSWTAWFTQHRQRLASVHILSTAPVVSLTVAIVSWRSCTGALIRVLSDPEAFARTFDRRACDLKP